MRLSSYLDPHASGAAPGLATPILALLFLRMAENRGLEPAGQLQRAANDHRAAQAVASLGSSAADRYRSSLLRSLTTQELDGESLQGLLTQLTAPTTGDLPAADLGRVYEQMRGSTASRKAEGIYYTPTPIVSAVVRGTLGRSLEEKPSNSLTVLDPACGSGAFLLAAYDVLRTALPPEEILSRHLFGVDRDPVAVEVTRLSLILKAAESGARTVPDLADHIQCGDALVGPDFCKGERGALAPCWNKEFTDSFNRGLTPPARGGFDWLAQFRPIMAQGGFSIVLGNPPWGQKSVASTPEMKQYLARRFPSSAGIHDLFRPFVELGIHLTAPGGRFGMVLPDIVLLKDYPQTRRYLLDHLVLERIDWWGRAFVSAMIDTVTIVGRKEGAPLHHEVAVEVHDDPPLTHAIAQADFLANPRHTFNLHLTPARRRVLDRLADCPRLGDYFEIHEGIHSGNIRAELFVSEEVDASCRPLLFGRDEISPYELRWQGKYVRLGALPARKTRDRYANLGQPQWHERPKVLVRRTGDFLLAAVEEKGRYASNNFFLVFPRRPSSLDLDGLCAVLNSRFMTWYFRAVEPRQGRAFAELKIKHLSAFPLPSQVAEPDGCRPLNDLGARRRNDPTLDEEIDQRVREMLLSPRSADRGLIP